MDLVADPRFSSNHLRTENHEALYAELESSLSNKPVPQWLEILNQGGIPCGPINNVEQVVNDPHVLDRNMIVSASSAQGVEFRMPGNPVKMSGYEDPATRKAAPALDQDRSAIMEFINTD